MAIVDIETFRKSLKTGLSRELIQKIVTAYESADFSKVNTNNGTKLRDIVAFSSENQNEPDLESSLNVFNDVPKLDYMFTKGAYLKYLGEGKETRKDINSRVDKVIRITLYSRPGSITLKSADILGMPQVDESCHIITINTDANSIASVTKAVYETLKKREVPFDIEVPQYPDQNKGFTETIKLHVTTADLEHTLKALLSLNKVYKDKIKQPNLFNANVDNLFGYDSYIDINGERASDKLGVVIIKAIDKTIAELGAEVQIENTSVLDYLRQAVIQDDARVKCLAEIKKSVPNIIDPILVNAAKIIKEEKIDLDPENIFLSDMAAGELNAEYGVVVEEVEETKELENVENKATIIIDKIVDKGKEVAHDIKVGASSVQDLLSNRYIQAAISFGSDSLEKIDEDVAKIEESDLLPGEEAYITPEVDKTAELVKAEPQVTVVEPIDKEVKEEEPGLDVTEANLAPIFGEQKEESVVLPGEEEIELPKAAEPVAQDGIPAKTPLEIVNDNRVRTIEQEVEEKLATAVNEALAVEEPTAPAVEAQAPVETQPANVNLGMGVVVPAEPTPAIEVAQVAPASVEMPSVAVAPAVPAAPITSEVQSPVVSEMSSVTVVPAESTPIVEAAPQVQLVEDIPAQPAQVEAQPAEQPQVAVQPQVVEQPKEELTQSSLEKIENVVSQMSTIEIPTEEIEAEVKKEEAAPATMNDILSEISAAAGTEPVDEEEDILSAITRNNSTIDGGNLSPEETLAVLTKGNESPQVKNEPEEINVEKPLINEDGTPVIVNGKEYTFGDFLNDNRVYDMIPVDSRVYLKDNTQTDSVDGITFIRDYVYKHAVQGNRSFSDILERYAKKIVMNNQEVINFPEEKKRGLLSIFKK